MLDRYFKYPLFWDYLISTICVLIARYFISIDLLTIPSDEHLYSTASDMSTIALTMAGFILTLLTVLISFKSTNKVVKNEVKENDKVFDVFFASKLYFQTVGILKNAILSLTLIAIIGYVLKLGLNQSSYSFFYYFCIFGIVVILLTLWRSIVILTSIVKMQESE